MTNGKTRLDPYLIADIKELRATGMMVKDIAQKLNFPSYMYSKWKMLALDLERKILNGEEIFDKERKLDKRSCNKRTHTVNLLNFLNAIREAERDYLLKAGSEFERAISEVNENENGKTD